MNERNLYEGLIRLKNDPAFSPVVEWIKGLREESRSRLETQVENVAVEQGKAQAYKKILDAIEKSPQVLQTIIK